MDFFSGKYGTCTSGTPRIRSAVGELNYLLMMGRDANTAIVKKDRKRKCNKSLVFALKLCYNKQKEGPTKWEDAFA